jgi:glucose-6-phosphate isomerase
VILPFSTVLDGINGAMEPRNFIVERRLSEMADVFGNREAAHERLAADGDIIVYHAYEAAVPHEENQLVYRTTVIEPGDVAGEFFMTKGHHHERDSAEFYLGMSGRGLMVMQDRHGVSRTIGMYPGTAIYVPPAWAHRTVNTDSEPLVFLAVFFGDAGHDYASIERTGFNLRVVRGGGGEPETVTAATGGV